MNYLSYAPLGFIQAESRGTAEFMAYESIQAPRPLTYMQPRPQKRDEAPTRRGFNLAHWLADEATANDLHNERFPVPLMSAEGILVLAQAQEEEFALHHPTVTGPLPEKIYNHAAEIAPPIDEDQLAFEFIEHLSGNIINDET